jgi:predicted nucleotidyltransferase
VHRATGDVDAVADEVVGLAVESGAQLLVDAGIAEPDPTERHHRVFIDGTKIEIIDTQELPSDVTDLPELNQLFVLGHRWAFESGEPLRIAVTGSDVDVVLTVATPPALVATKVHAFCDRQGEAKRASDAYDIYRLLETYDHDGHIAQATRRGPRGLAGVMREVLDRRFLEDATRVVRYLKTYGDPAWPAIESDDIGRVVGTFTARL